MGRSSLAGALAITLALPLGLLISPANPAAAETTTGPREMAVLPENEPTVRPQENLLFAGTTGFLHRRNGATAYLWTRYDTGATVEVPDLAGMAPTALKYAGGDSISTTTQVPARPAPGKVSVLDLSDQSWQQWEWPSGAIMAGIYGRTMVLVYGTTSFRTELRTFAADGTYTTTPVTGLPSNPVYDGPSPVGDGSSAVLRWYNGGIRHYGLIDLSTGVSTEIPQATSAVASWRLSGDVLAWVDPSVDRYHVYSRKGLHTGTDTAPRTLDLPDATVRSAVLGDRLIAAPDQVINTATRHPAFTVPVSGGDRTTVLPQIAYQSGALIQGPDGTALVVGGSDSRDWAVHRFTASDTGAPTDVAVLPVRDPVKNAALTYDRSLVRHVQTQISPTNGATQYAMFNHTFVPDTDASTNSTAGVVLPGTPAPCATGVECVRLVDGFDGGAAYLSPGNDGTTSILRAVRGPGGTSGTAMTLLSADARLVDASASYVVVNGGSPATRYVINMTHQEVVRTGPVTGASIWYDTLWAATATNGQLTGLNLRTGAITRTVSTGAACIPSEVQSSARWLYWRCAGSGPAGVYDLTTSRNIPVPNGPVLLGDGFLVRHDADTASLQLTDFHDGTLRAPVRLADLPVDTPADGRGVTWTVDRHGAGVAYVDADDAVHVLDTGVPGTAPAIGWSDVTEGTYPRETGGLGTWRGYFQPTRPLTSWQVTIRRKSTGETVATSSGGAVRTGMSVAWDGHLPSGALAVNGGYRWTLTGVAAGPDPVTIGSGTLMVYCGVFPFRTYNCAGGPAVLTVGTNNGGIWYDSRGSEPTGQLLSNGQTESWCLTCTGSAKITALVPFGDFDGDQVPDLLVRTGDGVLKAYLGIGQASFSSETAVKKSIGSGWSAYRLLVAPGDLNRDRVDDLVAIDGYGKLWLYTGTGKGAFTARVQIGSGWGIYPKVIGVGDLNGDGNGDMIARDSSGLLYRYSGDGKGRFLGRVQIGTGWNIYNALVPIGDLNQDNRNDLLARDAYGVLWLYPGRGNGTFGSRVQKATGWKGLAGIY